ncbi:unnamed protein product [Blepharisma stoltei]|uniref:ODAD1 central coiled coil region domain-containing protein n=1 Tax=Blepharisma stoltei TaxID=1481888 RepID=A0AAU9J271_9CILI|nr:unnamed protein product [Blepharisma stoltei]
MLSNRSKVPTNVSRSSTSLREPEVERIQREVDLTIRKFEAEKRESAYLDEQIKAIESELTQTKNRIKLPQISNDKSLERQLNFYEKQLNLEIDKLNNECISNKEVRDKIEFYRMDLQACQKNIESMSEEIKKYADESEKLFSEYEKSAEQVQKHHRQLGVLRSKSAHQRNAYSDRVSSLMSFIKDSQQSQNKSFQELDSFFKYQALKPLEVINLTKILSVLLSKWRKAIKTQTKAYEDYKKHIKTLQFHFHQITEATGIESFEDMVTSFIKSEEQNYEVYKYVNDLNAEIDALEDSLKRTTKRIKSFEDSKEISDKNDSEISIKIKNKLENLNEKSRVKINEYEEIQNLLDSLLPVLKKIIALFESLNIPYQLKPNINISEITNLTEDSASLMLGQIESCFPYILIFTSDAKYPYLDLLNPKEFDTQSINISNLEIKDNVDGIEDIKVPLPLTDLKQKAKIILDNQTSATSRANSSISLPKI